jgi:hypothetical protein
VTCLTISGPQALLARCGRIEFRRSNARDKPVEAAGDQVETGRASRTAEVPPAGTRAGETTAGAPSRPEHCVTVVTGFRGQVSGHQALPQLRDQLVLQR